MKTVGLLGGVASGKSSVAKLLADRGAVVLDADRVGHDILTRPDIQETLRYHWGERVFSSSNTIDRREVANIVFADNENARRELAFLEKLTHPCIEETLKAKIAELTADGCTKLAVLDAPVMLKAGWNHFCDSIIFVDVPRTIRLFRVRERGWTDKEFAAREASQESLEVKRDWADVVIDNSGSLDTLQARVDRFWVEHIGEIPT